MAGVGGGATKRETESEEDSSYYLWKSRANLTSGATGVFPVNIYGASVPLSWLARSSALPRFNFGVQDFRF